MSFKCHKTQKNNIACVWGGYVCVLVLTADSFDEQYEDILLSEDILAGVHNNDTLS